jgi:hypothetical protein
MRHKNHRTIEDYHQVKKHSRQTKRLELNVVEEFKIKTDACRFFTPLSQVACASSYALCVSHAFSFVRDDFLSHTQHAANPLARAGRVRAGFVSLINLPCPSKPIEELRRIHKHTQRHASSQRAPPNVSDCDVCEWVVRAAVCTWLIHDFCESSGVTIIAHGARTPMFFFTTTPFRLSLLDNGLFESYSPCVFGEREKDDSECNIFTDSSRMTATAVFHPAIVFYLHQLISEADETKDGRYKEDGGNPLEIITRTAAALRLEYIYICMVTNTHGSAQK